MSSWFQSTNIASLAKNALKEAQKTIDKALDINQEHSSEDEPVPSASQNHNQVNHLSDLTNTVTGAATEFFNNWGVAGVLKEKETHDIQNAPQSDNIKSKEVVDTVPPKATSKSVTGKKPRTRTRRKSSKSSRTSAAVEDTAIATFTELSLSDGEHIVENDANILEAEKPNQRNTFTTDPLTSFNFQPLWLDVDDQDQPKSCSSDRTSLSAEPNALQFLPADDLLSPRPPPADQVSTETCSQAVEVKQNEAATNEEMPSKGIEVPTEMLIDTDCDNLPEATDKIPSVPDESAAAVITESSTSEDDETNRQRMNSESDTNTLTVTDLESSSATTIMQDSRENSDENEGETNPTQFPHDNKRNRNIEVENEESDREASPTLLSPSSRAMSSVSDMSEEKQSHSEFDSRSPTNSNHSGPSSPNPEHGTDSQMLISIKQSALARAHPHSHSSDHNQKSPISTPERGHSRSNSNSTSSSIDQQHQGQQHATHTLRSHVSIQQNHIHSQGGRIVPISSGSSSDIEVISLDSSMYHATTRRPSFVEVETQTDASDNLSLAIPAKLSTLLAEKEAEIAQLREEGEKLSKKQFDLTTIIKKLRAKEKETEGVIKGLKNEIDTKSIEVERVTKTFLQKESIEQKQVQTISKLNNEKAKLEDTISELRSQLEDSTENCASMKASLEDASIEILELQNTIASAQHDTTQIDALTREKSDLSQQNQSFKREIEQLRSSLSSVQAKSSAREQELKAQIVEQAQAIQTLETQLGDVTDEIADATMPLSIEIEKLQSELKTNELQFQKRERQLNDQLLEMNLKLKQALEREKSSQDYQTDYKSTIRQLETQIERLGSDNNALSLEIRNMKEENVTRDKTHEGLQAQLLDQKNELDKSNFIIEKLESDLKAQTTLYEAEKKKCSHLLEQLRQHEQSVSMANESGSTSPTQTTLRANRSPTMSEASYLEEVFESNHTNNNIGNTSHHSLHNHTGTLTPKSSIFDSLPIYNQASSSPYFETLYAQLRQRENELIQLQTDSVKNEKIRKTLNDEIAKLTVENQQLDAKLEQLTDVQNRLSDVEKNYNAVLQLYGEKVEEVEELRMDLADVKEMYKTQIEQLVKK